MSNYVRLDEMFYEPLEWENPPDWLQELNESFNDPYYHVHQNNFDYCFARLQGELHGWVKAGAWAFQMRVKKAYPYVYNSWQEFCEKGLGRSQFTVNNYIKAARVFKELAFFGFSTLPKNVSQCVPLFNLKEHELTDAWQKVIDENIPHRITQTVIQCSVKNEPMQPKKRLQIPMSEWEDFQDRCREAGLNPKEELEKVLKNYDPQTGEIEDEDDLDDDEVEPVDPQKIEAWQLDLENLVKEYDNQRNTVIELGFLLSLFLEKLPIYQPCPPD